MRRSQDRRRPVAAVLALLLLLEGLLGAFLRPPVAVAEPLQLCTGGGIARLAPDPEGAPGEVDRPSCLLCLLPAATEAPAPPALPLPAGRPLATEIGRAPPAAAASPPRPSWPRAPPHG